MENVNKLCKWFKRRGWYSHTATLQMGYEGAFEGFSGRASEDWEYRPVIKMGCLKDNVLNDIFGHDGCIVIPAIHMTGTAYQTLDNLAELVMLELIRLDYYHES